MCLSAGRSYCGTRSTSAGEVREAREADVGRPRQLHFVATPLPNLQPEKRGLLRKRIVAAEKTLGIQIGKNSIRYWSPAALTERLFVLDEVTPQPGLVQDHNTLCDRITGFNRNGLDFLTIQIQEAIETDDVALAGRLAEVLIRDFPDRPEAFFLRSRLARLENRAEDAIQLAEKAFAQDPLYEPPYDFLRAHYERSKQPAKLEAMCERLLSISSRLSRSRKNDVLSAFGLLEMSIGKNLQAANQFKELLEADASEDEQPPRTIMVHQFNAAESARRAGLNVDFFQWEKIIRVFETFASSDDPSLEANRLQAMHIPYALTGDIAKARDCLRKAHHMAEAVNDFELIFSVRDYREVSREEFRTINDNLLAALDRGELWDGTKLSSNPNKRTAS